MSFFMILFWFFLAYILYQVVFKFVLPIYRTTRQVKRGFRDMQDRMQQHQNAQQRTGQHQNIPKQQQQPQNTNGDYIDFEEVKD